MSLRESAGGSRYTAPMPALSRVATTTARVVVPTKSDERMQVVVGTITASFIEVGLEKSCCRLCNGP